MWFCYNCAHVQVHVCMSMGALACVGTCVETRGPEVNLGHCFFGALLLCCRKGLSLVAKAHQVDSAGSQQAPGIFVCLSSWSLEYSMCRHTWLLAWVLGIKFSSSWLHSTHITPWDTFLASVFFFFRICSFRGSVILFSWLWSPESSTIHLNF